jgi:heme O synthase-like polyprenyltransferase
MRNMAIFPLKQFLILPMNKMRKPPTMMITIPISDTVVRAAQDHNMQLEEFVDSLIDKGMEKATGRPMVTSAIDRIRALHTEAVGSKR